MINGKLIVDNFAGGGGASTGIEMATGYSVDIAINHDPEAIKMHKANHPSTKHYCEDVWQIDPIKACNGNPVALAWFSPDCKHFSKAKGGKPKDKFIRGLAWVACRWAGLVRPDVIMLENVEEFKTWGPLNRGHHPIKKKQGYTFRKFISQLEDIGYQIEFNELIAADFGAPTMRKRFFMIARCDGKPIIWPEPTHAPRDSEAVKNGLMQPYVGAYTQLDFDRPCPSIFDTSEEIKEKYGIRAVRPLAPKTMERIARGLKKFVIEAEEPFILQVNHSGAKGDYCKSMNEPLQVITSKHGFGMVDTTLAPFMGTNTTNHIGGDCKEPIHTITTGNQQCLIEPYMVQIGQTGFCKDRSKSVEEPLTTIVSKNGHCMISANLIQYHSYEGKDVRGQEVVEPIMTVDGSNRYGLVTSFIQKYYGGNYKGNGSDVKEPLHTITTLERNAMCAVNLVQMNNHCDGRNVEEPIPTITAGDGHFGEVRTFLTKFYGCGTGQSVSEPLDTVTSRDRFGLVTIHGVDYQIVDIGLRMLEPKELYGCQGFPDDYIIDHDYTGKSYPRSEQVRRCGNAVCPPVPAAMVKANLPEYCTHSRMPNMSIDDSTEQLSFVI